MPVTTVPGVVPSTRVWLNWPCEGTSVTDADILPRRQRNSNVVTISPEGGVGRQAVEAYARRQSRTVEQFLGGPPLTPADVGAAVLRLLWDRSLDEQIAFRLDHAGLTPLKRGT